MAEEKCETGDKRDWTELPELLLHLIYKKLPDLRDFIRFRTVCKSWCSSAPLADPPEQQLPWLLNAGHTYRPEVSVKMTEKQVFYTLGSGEVGSFDIEHRYRGKEFCGACRGYLLLSYDHDNSHKGQQFALFNLLTNSYSRLAHLPQSFFAGSWRSFESYCPVWTNTKDPISNKRIAVFFLTHSSGGRPAIYNPHNKEWVTVNYDTYFTTCCFMKGMFVATSLWGQTCIICAKSFKLLYKVPPPMEEQYLEPITNYLIACSEVILRVCWLDKFMDVKSCKFLLYKLDTHVGAAHHNWVRISYISDQMLFLDELNGFSTCARPTDGFKGNCIYFLHPWPSGRPYRYDIATGTSQLVPCPFQECRWFFPGLH